MDALHFRLEIFTAGSFITFCCASAHCRGRNKGTRTGSNVLIAGKSSDRDRVRICIPKTPPDFNSQGAEFDIKLAFCLHHARCVHHAAERQKIKASWCVSGNKTPTVHATGSLLAVRRHCKRRSPVAAPSKTTAPIGIQLWGWMSDGMKGEEREKKNFASPCWQMRKRLRSREQEWKEQRGESERRCGGSLFSIRGIYLLHCKWKKIKYHTE